VNIFQDEMTKRGKEYDMYLGLWVESYRATKEKRTEGCIPEAEYDCLQGREKANYVHDSRVDGVSFFRARNLPTPAYKRLSEAEELAKRFGNLDI
jgi:hypothetical protein